MAEGGIFEKLKQMLNRTSDRGCSEAEVEAALSMARRLMEKHGITQEQLDSYCTEDGQVTPAGVEACNRQEAMRKTGAITNQDLWLAKAVAFACDVKSYTSEKPCVTKNGRRNKERMLFFYGFKDDVALAVSLFQELRIVLRIMARVKIGPGWTQSHYHYCEGFTTRLVDKCKSERSASTGTGLILRKDAVIQQYAAQALSLTTVKSRRQPSVESAAYSQGYVDGASFDMSGRKKKKIKKPTAGNLE